MRWRRIANSYANDQLDNWWVLALIRVEICLSNISLTSWDTVEVRVEAPRADKSAQHG